MPGRVRFAWPPKPFVEEEPVSLAKELNGPPKANGKPGGGTVLRGTVDQYPVIMDVDSSPALSKPPSASSPPGMGNISSDDNSCGPRTPPPLAPERLTRTTSDPRPIESKSVSFSTSKPSSSSAYSTSNQSRGRSSQVYQQPLEQQTSRQPRPRSQSRPREAARSEAVPVRPADSTVRGQSSVEPQYNSRSETAPISRSRSTTREPRPVEPHTTKRPQSFYAAPSSTRDSASTYSQQYPRHEMVYPTSGSNRGTSYSQSENTVKPHTVYTGPSPSHAPAYIPAQNARSEPTYNTSSATRGAEPPYTRSDTVYTAPGDSFGSSSVQPKKTTNSEPFHNPGTSRSSSSVPRQSTSRPETVYTTLASTRGLDSGKPQKSGPETVQIVPSTTRRPSSVHLKEYHKPETVPIAPSSSRAPTSSNCRETSRPETIQIAPNTRGSGPEQRIASRPEMVQIIPDTSRGPSSNHQSQPSSRGPARELAYSQGPPPPEPSLRRSNSTKTAPPAPMPAGPRPEPKSAPSDSVITKTRPASYYGTSNKPSVPTHPSTSGRSRATPTLAERIEEKLRLRHSPRVSGTVSVSDTEAPPPVPPVPQVPPMSTKFTAPVSAPGPHSLSEDLSGSQVIAPPPVRSALKNPNTSSEPTLFPDKSSSSSRRRSNSVKFNEPVKIQIQHEPSQKRSPTRSAPPPAPAPPVAPPQALVVARAPDTTGLCTIPCPRSIPVAGLQDWYTLKGLEHLDICPSCMGQIAHSRFREYFVPSLPKPVDQKIRCAFANAWTRLAWTQMIKKHHSSLEMLYQMTRPPPGSSACPGRVVSEQAWHRIVDPETGTYLPRFHICSSCARNVRILMPSHRETFEPSPDIQERVCDFVTTSPRFVQYIDLLDNAAARTTDSSRRPDLRDFLAYTRRKVVLRDCRRDRASLGNWHYIPNLPELTVCEDCYDEVVWPLTKAQQPIARMFSPSMRPLPGDGPNHYREASCQLYSPRMRARFREMVAKDDFAGLKSFALRRFEAERRFRDRREELMISESKGYNVDEEMRKAVEEWRKWE
ncbi:hypothetical protein N7468_001272 [Penicillium chermesinum]|uniref:Uncharacterized protein n=1 Tax=Penicillium chermesinum TaxID=63820 RepID=A0A9W9PG83_9EURO|nr:uncharacterized protein N7468_001272 [Penicillium chermesinum]KAJ5246289.1 hypothetical protein N7468_001272 [Penicillium chermesinum]